jgi:hypothetical protein
LTDDPNKAPEVNTQEGLKKFKEAGIERTRIENERWEKEIQGLQSRTEILEIEEMDLGNGVNIALRTNLTQAEAELLDTYKAKMQIAQKDGNVELAREYSYKLYSLVTANPLITEEWCAKNTDKYNLMDMTVLIAKFGEILTEKTMRIVKAQSFRSK